MLEQELEHELWLINHAGERVAQLDFLSLLCAGIVGDIGQVVADIPDDFDEHLLQVDYLLEFWRAPPGGVLRRVNSGFLRDWNFITDELGRKSISLIAPDLNELATRRIVAYNAGSSQALKTANADDMMKAIIRENYGALATDTDRQITDFLTIEADNAGGGSITKSFARQQVLSLLQAISNASAVVGERIYWAFEQDGPYHFKFRTYVGQPGVDHTAADNSPLVFSEEFDNLAEPIVGMRYSQEVTWAQAGGQGQGEDRDIQSAEDTLRSGRSPINRREAFVNASNQSSAAGVLDVARQQLDAGRPHLLFRGRLLDVEPYRFGVDWNFGDRVPVEDRGQTFNALVKGYTLRVNSEGVEDFTAWAEVDDVIAD